MDVISALPNVNLNLVGDCVLLVLAVIGMWACSSTIFECWRYNKWLTTVADAIMAAADTTGAGGDE